MKRILTALLFLLLVLTNTIHAAPVDATKAKKVAENYLNNKGLTRNSKTQINLAYEAKDANSASQPFLYVFNGSDCFAVVSGDDNTNPVLGYSANGTFDKNNIPPSLLWFLGEYEKEIEFVRANKSIDTTTYKAQWLRLENSSRYTPQPYDPNSNNYLIKTTWGQSPIYNDSCPVPGSGATSTPTGCVATAMAQIIRYWGVDKGTAPAHGYGSHSYTSDYRKEYANFACSTYDYANMPINVNSSSSQAQKQAVAKLMYHCGVSVDMDYDVIANGGSSASVSTAASSLTNYFGYGASYKWKSSYSTADWVSLLQTEIKNDRPVIYRGDDVNGKGGHAWICDGYDTSGYFHMNWGWSGAANGWFLLSALNTETPSYDFSKDNAVIVGIQPQREDYIKDSLKIDVCEGTGYAWQGVFYNKTGVYIDTVSCDTIKILNLAIHPKPKDTTIVIKPINTICKGDYYYISVYGNVYESGKYTRNIVNKYGCDSTITYDVTLNIVQRDTIVIYDTICKGETYNKNGFNISSGSGKYTLSNGTCGVKMLYLIEKQPVYTNIAATICHGETYTENDFNVSTEGEHKRSLTAANGCDSIVILQLTVNPAGNCEFNINVSAEGSECQSNGMIKIDLTGDNVSNLSQIFYTVKGNGNTYSGARPVFTDLPNGTYTVTVTAMLNGKQIEKTATVTIIGSYVVPSAVKVVGSSPMGTRPSFSCKSTGRVQLKITGGIFPYTVKVYSGGTLIKTEVFYSQQNFGTNENSVDYKDYYNIEDLAAGSYKFVVTDGCDYIMPEINETVGSINDCSAIYTYIEPYSGNVYSNNIIQFYISNNSSYYSLDNWEYSYSYNGGTYTNWKTFSNNGYIYDTVQNATKYCEIWDKEYTFKIRVKGCTETCTKTLKVNKPSANIYQNANVIEDENTGCPNKVTAFIYAYGYNGSSSSYSRYYTLPLTIKATNKTTGALIDYVIENTTLSWSYRKNIPEEWYGQTINVLVTDKNGCVIADLNQIIEVPTIPPTTSWNGNYGLCNNSYTDYYICCGYQQVYVYGDIVKGSTVELFSSPNSNYYNYKAEYDKDNNKWTVVSKQNESIRTDTIASGRYLQDSTLMSGTYIYRITDDCGRNDTVTVNALFYKYEIRDSISHDSLKNCDGMYYYLKGQNVKKTTQPDGTVVPTDASTWFSVVSGVSGGYSFSGSDLYVTKPGKYIVKMYYSPSSSYPNDNPCLDDYDTIVYNPQNVAIKDIAGYVCLDVGDDETTKLGNILVRVDSTTGVAPYKFDLFSQEDGGGTILETNNTGLFSNVGKVNQTLSVRVTDDCGASFIQNIKMISIGLDLKNKGWATNSTVCLGSKIELHSLQIGSGSVAKYTWTKPNGELYEGQNLTVDSATMSDSGNYCLDISGIQCPMKDTVAVKVIDVIRNTVQDSVCEGNNYSGNKFKALATSDSLPGLYTFVDTLQNNIGCDSIVTLNLKINKITYGIDSITVCDKLLWIDGKTYTENNNTAKCTITNPITQCDSIVTLNLTILKSTYASDTITECNTYTWSKNNQTYTESGIYKDTLTNSVGCDSIVTLHLTINKTTYGTDLQTACDSYTWIDGKTYTESDSTAQYTLTNSVGCDSIVTLHLTINKTTYGTDHQKACDSYTWIDGKTYTESNNTAQFTTTNVAGCDSIVTLHLTINKTTYGTDPQTACDSYTWIDGKTYTESNNTAQYTLTNSVACDSIVTLNLTILKSTYASDTITECNTYTWNKNNQTYTESGVYKDTLTNSVGCDSIVTLYLTINKTTYGTDPQIACYSYTWIDGKTYTESNNTAQYTLTNSVGCDSIVTLNLTINKATYYTDEQTACDSLIWLDGKTYTESNNTAQFTTTNVAGCDSIITLNLKVNYSQYTTIDTTIIGDGYEVYDKHGFYETEDGTFYQYLHTYYGCDSTVILNLKVKPTIQMPDAIDPSDESVNRTTLRQRNQFGPIISGKTTEYEYKMLIFDRWNTLIFETNKLMDEALDPTKHYWDGKFKGKTLPEDAYLYYIKVHLKKFDDIYEKKGTVSIIYK